MRRIVRWLWIALFLALDPARADLKLGTPFTDHAVLQREQEVAVWGWGDAGSKITLTGSWGKHASTVCGTNRAWIARIRTPAAGGPYTLTVEGEGQPSITITNLMIGEVWICAGQSNMEWTMGNHKVKDGAAEIAAAKYPAIRLLRIPKVQQQEPAATAQAAWRVCGPDTVGAFSAVGYFFGRDLFRELNVPIGLIDVSWGGTEVEAWIPREGFSRIPELAARLNPATGKGGNRPGWLYNGLVAPIAPYRIRGVIWYQGESNVGRAAQYDKSFPLMIDEWRRVFEQPVRSGGFRFWRTEAMPFYFVQIAPFTGYGNRGPASASAELREAQFKTYRATPRSGLVVITDITGNLADIHPENKQDVGSRLARWALTHDYGRHRPFSGPLYKRSEIEGEAIRIHFDHADGLAARGNALTEFTIAGTNGVFSPATAMIDGETVLVSSTNVPSPAYVRFGWADASVPNLFNGAGLPASPFRTDCLPRVTETAKW